MARLLILGAGGHAQVVAEIVHAMARVGNDIEVAGFLDDDPQLWGHNVLGATVFGPTRSIPDCEFDSLIIGIGSNAIRQQLSQHWQQMNATFGTLIHPSAVVAHNVEIGPGTVLCAGVIVNTGSHIGRSVILNTACSVDHHNVIGDYAHIAPGARLGGDVQVAEGSLVGIGAIVLPQQHVGDWATVGAGAVVTQPVVPGQTVIGIPAHPLERHASHRERAAH